MKKIKNLYLTIRNRFLLMTTPDLNGELFIGTAKGLVKSGNGSDKEETLVVRVWAHDMIGKSIYTTFAYLPKDGTWQYSQKPKKAVTEESFRKLIKQGKLTFATNEQKEAHKWRTYE